MNSFKLSKTTESGDMIYTEYKGKIYAIPRSEYKKPLQTIPGQNSLATTSCNLISDESQSPPSTTSVRHKPTNVSFSLDALTESRETLQNVPTPTITSTKSGDQAIADSLQQLKLNVVDLIDKTISDIETKQQQQQDKLATSSPSEGITAAVYENPGGDSPKTVTSEVAQHRVQNLQVLKTESFAQSKREVRKTLYREIEAILVQLKDMDFLE